MMEKGLKKGSNSSQLAKISHIKIVRIRIVLGFFVAFFASCYLPKGAWMTEALPVAKASNDSIFIALPIDFQKYNYFKVTYVKNKIGWRGEKINDSTLVFFPLETAIFNKKEVFRVEGGIIPFFEKKSK